MPTEVSMAAPSTFEPIPQPPGHLLIGNLLNLRLAPTLIESLMALARQYGPIFRLQGGRAQQIVVSGYDLVNEICNDQKFDKYIGPGLRDARAAAGDGLFTAWTYEPNWHKAHNILLPTFSQQ